MPTTIALAAIGIAALYLLLRVLIVLTHHAQEPQVIDTTVPFLGPMVGSLRNKAVYYAKLRLPIYTLRLPGIRSYIINAVELIPVVQRQWRIIDNTPLGAEMGPVVLGITVKDKDVLISAASEFPKVMQPLLAPGAAFNSIIRSLVDVLATRMQKLRSQEEPVLSLYSWADYEMRLGITDALYGPQNPFRQPAFDAAWRHFSSYFLVLAFAPFPRVVAPMVVQARETLANGFLEYLQRDGLATASEVIKQLNAVYERHGFGLEDLARMELGNSMAGLSSAPTTAFWLVYHIFSNPKVLEDVRREVSVLVDETEEGICSIDAAAISRACPILLSVVKEVLRYRGVHEPVRVCVEDHMLDDRYFLKKGSLVMLPNLVYHTDPKIWGNDAGVFDYRRFLREPNRIRPNPVAFRGFGGGHVLCPGRHLASAALMSFAGLLAMQYDIIPVGGSWVEPTCKSTPMVASLQIPDQDMQVKLRARDDRKWRVSFSSYNSAMKISAEDMEKDEK
ncbi:cytochrome P450 [Thozetella sp. PMI_491]|nr:cytochrome P450 [Thozetella sp. PMI_491]